jgi:hypothetical protein
MSHKVKLGVINNPNLGKAMNLLKTKVLWNNMQSTIHCLNVITSLQEAITIGREYYKILSEKYMVHDDEGKLVVEENGMPKISDPTKMDEEFKELLEVEIEICGRLDMGKIHDSKLTAEDLESIRFLFHA